MLFEVAEISDKEGFKFRLSLLNAENHFTWSHVMEVVLRGRGFWKFVDPSVRSENSEAYEGAITSLTEADETKRDLALTYILTFVDSSCKGIIRQVRCPQETCVTLCKTFQTVSEASIDAKLSKLQALTHRKGEHIVEYSNRFVDLIGELQGAGNLVTLVEQKRALLRGLPKE